MQSLVKVGMLVAVVTLLVACNPLREISNIRVTVTSESEVQGTIAGTNDLLKTAGFEGFTFDVKNNQTFQNSDATRDNLESSSLRSFTLRVQSPEGQDLDFINEMRVFINADGEKRKEITNNGRFEPGVSEVQFENMFDVDLAPYFTAEEAVLSVEAEGTPPEETTTLQIEMVFNINFLI